MRRLVLFGKAMAGPRFSALENSAGVLAAFTPAMPSPAQPMGRLRSRCWRERRERPRGRAAEKRDEVVRFN